MSKSNNQTATSEQKPAEQPALTEAEGKRLAVEANAKAEAGAFTAQVNDTLTAGAGIKPMALDILAHNYGESAGTKGRPTMETYIPFILCLANAKVSADRRKELARKANAAQKAKWGATVGEGKFIPVATEGAKSQANGDGSAKWAFRKPVAFDIAAS